MSRILSAIVYIQRRLLDLNGSEDHQRSATLLLFLSPRFNARNKFVYCPLSSHWETGVRVIYCSGDGGRASAYVYFEAGA